MHMKRAAFERKQVALRQAVAIGDAILRTKCRELVAACFVGWRMRARVSLLLQQRLGERLRGSLVMAWAEWVGFHCPQVSIDSILAGAAALCVFPEITALTWGFVFLLGLTPGPSPKPASCVPQLPGRLPEHGPLRSLERRGRAGSGLAAGGPLVGQQLCAAEHAAILHYKRATILCRPCGAAAFSAAAARNSPSTLCIHGHGSEVEHRR